jgi:protease-4
MESGSIPPLYRLGSASAIAAAPAGTQEGWQVGGVDICLPAPFETFMQPPKLPGQRSQAGWWITILLLALALCGSLALNLGLLSGQAAKGRPAAFRMKTHATDEFPAFREIASFGEGAVKAVRIPIEGIIMRESEGGPFEPPFDKIEYLRQQIRAARNDDAVMAIILEIDSPGGGITASDELYQALMEFKKSEPERKIIAHMRDLGASGAYYVAMSADWIIAEPTSVVGSIGVIMQALNWKTLSEKIGLSATTIKSGRNKDLLNPFEEVPPEQVALLQELIDDMYQRFFHIVQSARGIAPAKLKPLADGRIFTASAALQHGLIDQIGYWDDVMDKTHELLDENSVRIVRYEQEPRFWSWLSRAQTPRPWRTLLEQQTPRMMYLWRP